MTHQSTAETRLSILVTYLVPVVTLLDELSDVSGISFVPHISRMTLLLITAVQVSDGFL
jgi:hypothetical protein